MSESLRPYTTLDPRLSDDLPRKYMKEVGYILDKRSSPAVESRSTCCCGPLGFPVFEHDSWLNEIDPWAPEVSRSKLMLPDASSDVGGAFQKLSSGWSFRSEVSECAWRWRRANQVFPSPSAMNPKTLRPIPFNPKPVRGNRTTGVAVNEMQGGMLHELVWYHRHCLGWVISTGLANCSVFGWGWYCPGSSVVPFCPF